MDLTGGQMDTSDTETVSLDEPAGDSAVQDASGPPEAINLCEFLTDEESKAIAARVCRDFDSDVESGSKHMKRLQRSMELYASIMKAKTWPFERAGNVNVPIVNYTVLQIHGRLYDMILPSKGELFHSLPTNASPDELERANRTELYLNYLARHEIPGFTQIYDELLFQMCIFGSAFMAYMWNEVEGRIDPVCIPASDFVVPYQAKSKAPDMRGVPRYTWIQWMTWFEIQDKGADGTFWDTERVKPTPAEKGKDTEFKNAVDATSGMDKPGFATIEDEDRQVLQMHIRWLKLPDDQKRHMAFDGKPHAVIAWVDAETEALLRLVVREEPDPKDKQRFDKESAARDKARQQLASFVASNGQMADPATGALVPMPKPAPVPPEPRQPRMREITFFTHYRAFPSEGFYGLGFGDITGPLNEAMNTIVNQCIDRGTVNNAGGGFRSRQLRFQAGPIMKQPGQYVEIDAPPAAMKDGLFNFPAIPADPEMIGIAKMVEGWAQRAAGSGDTLSGEPVNENESAAGAKLRYEAAQKQISVLGSRVISYMKNDVDMIWRLLSVFLPEQDQASVPGKDGQPTNIPLSRADFVADQRVFPAADPRVTSRSQRVSDADDAYAFAMSNPLMAQNPQIMHALTERCLHARDMGEMVPLLAPAVPPPPPPIPQTDENAQFLQGGQPKVNPQDNHDEHLATIAMFKQSPEFLSMTPQMTEALDQHARNHVAQKMLQESQNGNPGAGHPLIPNGVGGGNVGMAPAPGNGAPPRPPGGAPQGAS